MKRESLESLKSRRDYIMRSMSYTAGRAGREGTGDTEHYGETMREILKQIRELDAEIAKREGKSE